MFISFKVMILVLFYILDNNYPDANTNKWYFHHNA